MTDLTKTQMEAAVRVNEKADLNLHEIASSGYVWIAGNSNPHVKIEREVTPQMSHGVLGNSLSVIFSIAADQPGTYEVNFKCVRIWDGDVSDHMRYVLKVTP